MEYSKCRFSTDRINGIRLEVESNNSGSFFKVHTQIFSESASFFKLQARSSYSPNLEFQKVKACFNGRVQF